jgi:LacI family transcriptional regulator
MTSDRQIHIGLMIHGATDYRREMRRGISAFARTRPSLTTETWDGKTPPVEWARQFKGDGLIAQVLHPPLQKYLRRQRRLAAVNISGWLDEPGLPAVLPDDMAIGRIAAEYFLQRGYQQFAYFGSPHPAFSRKRCEAFGARLGQADHEVRFFTQDLDVANHPDHMWQKRCRMEWLASLRSPAALFVQDDTLSRDLLKACLELGRTVPDEIAILGVNDDELVCEMSQPELSSVQARFLQVGYQATARVVAVIEGSDNAPEKVLVPPGRVTERGSTQALAIEDPVVARAMRFILDHANRVITVDSVLDELGVSRRSLEMKFRKALDQTPWEVIRQTHIRRSEQFLISSDYAIGRIAELSGFKDAYQFSVMFKNATGLSPSHYRDKHRA